MAYACGSLAGQRMWRPTLWWLVAAGTLVLAALIFLQAIRSATSGHARALHHLRGRIAFGFILGGVAALGALSVEARSEAEPGHGEWQVLTDGRPVTVVGYVVHDGLLRGSGAQRRESVDVQVEGVWQQAGSTSVQAGSSAKRAADGKRRANPCINAAWPAELLRASGLPVCNATGLMLPNRAKAVIRQADRVSSGDLPASPETDDSDSDAPVAVQGPPLTPDGIVRLSVYSREVWDEADNAEGVLPKVFTYGQRLRFTVKLRPPHNFGNPGALDYAAYLRGQGIYALGSLRGDRIESLAGIGGTNYQRWRSRIRRSLMAEAHKLWPGEQAGLLEAMLIGERSFIGHEVTADFQRTGIYHILVVSGMNVGILALVIFWLLRRFRCGELVATILTMLLSFGYAYVAEMGTPIVRSVVMLSVYLLTRLLYRDRAMLNAVGAAALVLLVIEPRLVADSSFQLTVLSVLAIGGIAVPILERTSRRWHAALHWLASPAYDLSLEPGAAQFRLDLRMIAERLAMFLPRWPKSFRGIPNRLLRIRAAQRAVTGTFGALVAVYDLVVVSATTQIALVLPMAWSFHRATLVGLPANLVAVPLTGILMPASVAAVGLAYLWMPLARVPAWITSWSLWGITRTVQVLGGLRAADVRLATPDLLPALAGACAFAWALLVMRRRWQLAATAVIGLIVTAVWIATVPGRPQVRAGTLEVTVIDVGQAESQLVVTPEGKTLLVDAAGPLGPWQSDFDFGEQVIAPYLWSRGITRLDAVAVTHAHSDHYGGMTSLLASFHPREMWVGPNAPDGGFDALLKRAEADGVRICRRHGGQTFQFGGTEIRVLAPAQGWQPGAKPRNNDSMVIRVAYGATSTLLTGDAEKKSEESMLGESPQADLLKVAHNGSRTSSTPDFLAAVHPRYAVISVGARNSFGHPRREVLERLAAMHVATYRTDMLGAVTFLLDGRKITPVVRTPTE